jgi:PAS domain S-box-containing protein
VSQGGSPALLAEVAGAPKAVEVVPIMHGGNTIASLIVGTFTYPDIPPTLRAGLQSLGAATGHSVSRIRAEQSRGDAVADLEALIAVNPTPTWVLDAADRVTVWNKAAERLFGWRASEVVGRRPPFSPSGDESDTSRVRPAYPHTAVISTKNGAQVEVRLVTAPFRDVVGDSSTLIVMAEDLTLQRRLGRLEERLAGPQVSPGEGPAPQAEMGVGGRQAEAETRVLIVDPSGSWGAELAQLLSNQGYVSTICPSADEAATTIAEAEVQSHPFALAVIDLVTPARTGGPGQTATLRGLGLRAPVIVSSDADVRGHEQHGIAAVIRRPYDPQEVARIVGALLRKQG